MTKLQSSEQFVQLLTQHQNHIYAYVLSLIGNPVEAHDVVQETNLVLWRKASEFELGTDFAAWAGKVAHFQVLYYRRRCGRDRLVFDDSVVAQVAEEYLRSDEDLGMREEALRACLDQMKPEQRRVIQKRYEPDGSVKDLASDIGRTPVATGASVMRLRRKLFDCIQLKMTGNY